MVRKHKAESYLERKFDRMIIKHRLPQPIRQFSFHRYRFDFCWPQVKVAVEIDGGTYMKDGGHARGARYKKDCIKNNLAQVEGWVVLRADRTMIDDPQFLKHVRMAISRRINSRRRNK